MAKKESVLIIDFGTSKVHTNIVSLENGELLGGTAASYSWKVFSDGAELLNPEHVWEAAQSALKKLLEKYDDNITDLQAIGMSFFGDNVIPVDEKGNSLFGVYRPCISEMTKDPKVAGLLFDRLPDEKFSSITGSANSVFYSPAIVLWYKANKPEMIKETSYFFSMQQYILKKMGLEPMNDYSSGGRRTLMDTPGKCWSKEILELLEIEPEQLGRLSVSSTIVGEIEKAGNVRLPKKLPVVLGAHDAASATLGLGILPDGSTNILGNSAGSYDLNAFYSDTFFDTYKNARNLMNGRGVLEDNCYYIQLGTEARQNMYWFLNVFFDEKEGRGLTELFSRTKFNGDPGVTWRALPTSGRVCIDNMNPLTTKEEIFAGLMEELTFPMLWNVRNQFEKVQPQGFSKMRIGSGGAKSDEWVQLKADMLQIPVERVVNDEISSVGAAMIAGIAIGAYGNYEDAIRNMVHVQKIFEPRKEISEKYQERYVEYCKRLEIEC